MVFIYLYKYIRWGQIAILTALADYKAASPKEAEGLCERVVPRLQHANGAVVLSVIKVIDINAYIIKHIIEKKI